MMGPAAAARLALLLLAARLGDGLKNGLDLTPPMGWSNWLSFGCMINEQIIRQSADALVAKGLRDVGYKTVGLDDCWAVLSRNESGHLVPNATLFPSGIKALVDYVHDRGLKFRIYSSAGERTCQNNMSGSLGYEWLDAQLFASWGVDALKYDDCFGEATDIMQDAPRRFPFAEPPILRYPRMTMALNRTGRNMSYMCNFPWDFWKQETNQALGGRWVAEMCNSWRTGGDSQPGFEYSMEVVSGAEKWAELVPSGPGAWNHLDALQIGNNRSFLRLGQQVGGDDRSMTEAQEQIIFSLYALVKTPLMIGADVITLSGHSLATYLNKEVIAVNQDPLGARGLRRAPAAPGEAAAAAALPTGCEVWSVPLSDGSVFAVLINRNGPASPPATIAASWGLLGMENGTSYAARDVWKHEELGVFSGSFHAEVAPQSCVAVRLRRSGAAPASTQEEKAQLVV